jgi:hypothetical protein
VAGPRTLVRFSQVRRTEKVDSTADEALMALGRYFQADCLALDVVGMFVYVTGSAVLGIPQVTKVDIQTYGKYPAVGMIVEKPTATRCLVQAFGEIAVLPAALIPGRPYFVGLDSLLTNIPPAPAPGTRAAIQAVGTAIDDGRLLLNVHPMLFLRSG